MPAVRLLERIEGDISEILDARTAPDDYIEWSVTLIPLMGPCESEDEGHDHEIDMVLSFYATLACPESGRRSTAKVLIPLEQCEPECMEWWVNDIWDRLTLNRMMASAGLEES